MAKQKLDKTKLNRYVSLAFPESIGFSANDEEENADNERDNSTPNKGVNNLSDTLSKSDAERANSAMAGGSVTKPAPGVTQNVNSYGLPKSSLPSFIADSPELANSNSIQPNFARPGVTLNPAGDFPESSMPSFARGYATSEPFNLGFDAASLSKQAPMMFGNNVNISNVARAVLSEDNAPTQQATVAAMSPEEKLLATIANTNPTPNSLWKRLLVGVAQGASMVDANKDTFGSAFGKILGGAVTRSIPAIDSANIYEEKKAKALERYRLESGAKGAELQRRVKEQEIANDQARITREVQERARQARIDAMNQADKLEDNKRAAAKQKLDTLEKMSPDDVNRGALIEELKQSYGITVGADFGTYDKAAARATDKQATETNLRKRAEAEVIAELGATTEERARGATKNKLDAALKQQMPADMYAALSDPNAGQFSRQAARKLANEIEDRMYKVDLDYTKSDFERRVSAKLQEYRGNPARTSSKPATKQATSKVQATPRASNTDARTLTFK